MKYIWYLWLLPIRSAVGKSEFDSYISLLSILIKNTSKYQTEATFLFKYMKCSAKIKAENTQFVIQAYDNWGIILAGHTVA